MLAAVTEGAVLLCSPSLLKSPPQSLAPSQTFSQTPTTAAWSPSNKALFVAFARSIAQHNAEGELAGEVYQESSEDPISCLVARDDETIIFSSGSRICLYEAKNRRLAHEFTAHRAPVIGLSLSNDLSLLASASSTTVVAHDIQNNPPSLITLRGLPPSSVVTTCVFHPHTRTRLLVIAGKELLVYDTTKPSAPARTITAPGDITGLSCSPFSKTLVALSCSGPALCLADLEKERGIVRTIPLNERPSCIAFAPDGSAILLGTHDGRLLVQNLRALDKPPTSTSLGDTVPVVAICVQGKARAPPKTVDRKPTSTLASPAPRRASAPHAKSPRPSTSRTSSAAVAKSPLARRGAPSSSQSPLTARLAASVSKGSTGTPITPVRSRKATEPVSKSPQVLFPVKDIGNANARATSTSAKTGKAVRPALKGTAKKENESTTPRSPPPSGLVATKGKPADARARATSSASARDRIRPSGSSSSTASKSSGRGTVREREPPPPVPPIPSAHRIEAAPPQHRRTRSAVSSASTRTPSPDLPSPSDDPVTPLPAGRAKKMSLGVLGLGSPPDPDTEKGKERAKAEADGADGAVRVGFADDSDEDGDADDGDDVVVVGAPPQRETSMQISPRPPRASVPHWAVPSPLRNSHGPNGLPIPSPSRPGLPSGAQELLRSIVQDVMLDFRQETRAEMMGLHLDLVRMGRGWKSELREALGGVGEEMERLREENRVLREENERLKRGY